MQCQMLESGAVAARLGLKVATLRGWARDGLIPAGRSLGGAKWLWSEDQIREIARMLEEGTVPEAEECHA